MTAIAAICTPGRIILAADSSTVNEKGELVSTDACKIRNLGTVVATATGMVTHPNGFDLFGLLPMAIKDTQTIHELVKTTEQVVRRPLYATLLFDFRNNPSSFQKNAIDMAPLAVVFVGQQNRMPVLANIRFVAIRKEQDFSLECEKRLCPGPDCPNGYAALFVGTKVGSGLFSRKSLSTGFYENNDPIAFAREFIQMEINKNLPDFQAPIDILEVTGTGVRWVQKKKNC